MKTTVPHPEQSLDERGGSQRARSGMRQNRAVAAARSALALRHELDTRVCKKEPQRQPVSGRGTSDASDDGQAGAEMLLRAGHKVLIRYLPGDSLPDELWKVRALLEAHMFGRDGRVRRDEVVELARQIDRHLPQDRS